MITPPCEATVEDTAGRSNPAISDGPRGSPSTASSYSRSLFSALYVYYWHADAVNIITPVCSVRCVCTMRAFLPLMRTAVVSI